MHLNMHYTFVIIYICSFHVNAKKWILEIEKETAKKDISNISGQDFSLRSPIKEVKASIGSDVQLRCEFNVPLSACQFRSPTGVLHRIGSRCESSHGNTRIENLCMVAEEEYDAERVCGIIIRNLKLEDAGKWKCEMESGGQWKSSQMIIKMHSSDSHKNRKKSVVENQKCKTVSGPDPGVPCVFPFAYRGEVHKKCTDLEHTGNWCATETDTDGNTVAHKWGDCDCQKCACSTEECKTVSGPDPGVPCLFPFTYNGEVYKKCTDLEHTGNWCATKTEKHGNALSHKWGDCDCHKCACSTAGQGQGISGILIKTGERKAAQMDGTVTIALCTTTKGLCCNSTLDDPAKDDRALGNIDTYSTASMLGECFGANFWGYLTATLAKDGTDGWFVDYAEIRFGDNRGFTCDFNNWLDNSDGYTNSMTVKCEEGQGIINLSTKTGSMRAANTNDHVEMTVCDTTRTCCTAALDHEHARKKGQVDMYHDPSKLGLCLIPRMKGQLTATLTKDGSNGWYVDWAQIRLARGNSFTCMFNNWLDNESGFKNHMTVPCNEDIRVTHHG